MGNTVIGFIGDLTMLLNVLAIILSIVALFITVVGFFASLKFYRDGVNLQNQANNLMFAISEKADSIQTQVGGMFDKTLDAAIAKREDVSEEFESLQQKLRESAEQVKKQVASEIKGLGQEEKSKVLKSVQDEFNTIASQLRAAKESLAESQIEDIEIPKIVRTSLAAKKILRVLSKRESASVSDFIGEGISENLIARRINRLLAEGVLNAIIRIDGGSQLYSLSDKGKAIARLISKA